ncbi:MAG: hypothetical protein ABEJ31_08395 [Haloarculaceae archaeon]
MPEPHWARHGLAIGRTEFRRTVRSIREDRGRLALLAFGGLFFLLAVAAGSYLLFRVAGDLGSYPLTDAVRGTFGLQWLFAVFIAGQRAATRHDRIDNDSLMLLTVSVRSIVVGLLTAEGLRALSYLGIPLVLLGGAFVLATGSFVTAPLLAVAVALFLGTALIAGYAGGLAAKLIVARVRFVARYKSIMSGVLALAFIGLYVGIQNYAGAGATGTLGLLPSAWLLDLALVGSPFVVSVPRAAAAAVGGLVWIAVWLAALEWLATELWFGDSVEPDVRSERARVDTGTALDPLAAATRPFVVPFGSQPTRRVAQRVVIVARRNPRRLSFVLIPVIGIGSSLINLARSGDLFTFLPPLLALLVPWLAGAAFGLNPLGDEGPVLPATLTSLPDGRQFATGLAIPGLVLGLPLTVALTVATGAASPFEPVSIGLLAIAGAALTVAAVGIAPGIGTTFPRFDPISVSSGREVVPPNLSAAIVYTLALALPGTVAVGAALAPAATRQGFSVLVGGLFGFVFAWLASKGVPAAAGVAAWLGDVGQSIAGLPTAWVHWGGYVLPLAIVLGFGWLGFRTVVRRFEGFAYD